MAEVTSDNPLGPDCKLDPTQLNPNQILQAEAYHISHLAYHTDEKCFLLLFMEIQRSPT